jgi:hypothetical protein
MDSVLMMDATQSKHWVADLKMNGSARNVAFSKDGSLMFSSGGMSVASLLLR